MTIIYMYTLIYMKSNNLYSLACFHRMVNACLAEELKEIHAFEQKTITPEQHEKQQSQ